MPHSDQSLHSEMNYRKEAADFYGLYRRGADLDRIRMDIGVPDYVLDDWAREHAEGDRLCGESIRSMSPYRQKVLAVFEELVARGVDVAPDRRGRPKVNCNLAPGGAREY